MFILMILERIKETRLKFSQESVTVLYIMSNYQKATIKLTNEQLNQLSKTGTMLRISKKKFQDEEMSHVVFLTTNQTTENKNAFSNNMLTDIKVSKAQISKMIQSC